MDRRIDECLSDSFERKYLLPFFWQHGSSRDKLVTEMDAIRECGIMEFCAESRTFKDFCGEGWWSDFGFLLQEAQKRGMKVWLLDDKNFPTGYANNYIDSHPELRKLSLKAIYRDFASRGHGMSLIVPCDINDCISVMAYRRTESENILEDDIIDLAGNFRDGLIYCALPSGMWRVYFVYRTREAVPSKLNYIDMLSRQSCEAMLHAVYQPMYDNFAPFFGNTFKGFFSDEPSFSNAVGTYHSTLGSEDMLIPWNEELVGTISQSAHISEKRVLELLPALWHDIKGATKTIRQHYMNAVTILYKDNFSCLLGDWCRERGVMYIGHIIEDMNTHQRLGYGAGHFFRSLDGQDMAGLDVVLHQIVPGFTQLDHTAPVCGTLVDPEFFNYALARLGSSHAHINPLMKGRAMCEIFGAFGWAEGIPYMKQLADHMLVNGVNHFVPHAFSDKYPNPDCPPHFYANGNNPQFNLFGQLMEYMQRISHLIDGGLHCPDVAVFYNAEAEWTGGEMMLFQKVTNELSQKQIDFDIIPTDYLLGALVNGGRMTINGENYGALIIPYSQILSSATLQVLHNLAERGLTVLYTDAYPSQSAEGVLNEELLDGCEVVLLHSLAESLKVRGLRAISLSEDIPLLRTYRYSRGGASVYILKNEDMFKAYDFLITLPDSEEFLLYDAWENRLERPEQDNGGVRVRLGEGGSAVLVPAQGRTAPDCIYAKGEQRELDLTYNIYIKGSGSGDFVSFRRGAKLSDITAEEGMSRFCGTIRYEADFDTDGEFSILDLGEVGETAQVWMNGSPLGARVSGPYEFDVRQSLATGNNKLVVEVINNLGYRERDFFSSYLPLPASGMLGPIKLKESF